MYEIFNEVQYGIKKMNNRHEPIEMTRFKKESNYFWYEGLNWY